MRMSTFLANLAHALSPTGVLLSAALNHDRFVSWYLAYPVNAHDRYM